MLLAAAAGASAGAGSTTAALAVVLATLHAAVTKEIVAAAVAPFSNLVLVAFRRACSSVSGPVFSAKSFLADWSAVSLLGGLEVNANRTLF